MVKNVYFIKLFIQELLHHMTKLEAGKVDGPRLNLINDIVQARHKPVI